MKKIKDMNTLELSALLVECAEPMGNLAADNEVFEAFRRCTMRGVGLKQRNGLRFILRTYAELFPLLFGEKHRMDTLRIMAAVEGKPLQEVIDMNGAEIIADFKKAWEEQLQDFFIQSAPTEQDDASSH